MMMMMMMNIVRARIKHKALPMTECITEVIRK